MTDTGSLTLTGAEQVTPTRGCSVSPKQHAAWGTAQRDRKALGSLARAQYAARNSPNEMQQVLDLARAIRDRAKGGTRRNADYMVRTTERRLAHLSDPAEIGVIASLPACRIQEGANSRLASGERVDLVFTTEAVFLRGDHTTRLDYSTIKSVELAQIQPPTARTAKKVGLMTGKAGAFLFVGTAQAALGALDIGAAWSAAKRLEYHHYVRVTLATTLGDMVLVHASWEDLLEWKDQLSKALAHHDLQPTIVGRNDAQPTTVGWSRPSSASTSAPS